MEIPYRRGVKPEGNATALLLMNTVFETGSANWRGIGAVPSSGLQIKKKYEKFDAEKKFEIKISPAREPKGCICGAVLRGVSTPQECTLPRYLHAGAPGRPVHGLQRGKLCRVLPVYALVWRTVYEPKT